MEAGDDLDQRTQELLGEGPPKKPIEVEQALQHVRSRLFGAPRRPIAIARYLLLDKLGEGGAGVVWTAYDPDLERKVAVKLVREGPRGLDQEAATRLLREAQAIARLSHPNVIAVHDVGRYDLDAGDDAGAGRRGVFVVMELVAGGDLARWLEGAPRSQREVLAVFVAAGRGLAAAHAAGLVHRDFKPSNVLVGDDGRVRVCDFGLARVAEPSGESADHPSPSSSLERPITRDGTIMGTPPYMAPEQHAGGATDARSDQFAFCAALFEALVGRRPYTGDSMEELRKAKESGAMALVPAGRTVAPHVLAALRRGLAPDPAQRFGGMESLLEVIARDPAARRRRALVLVGAMVVAAGLGGAIHRWQSTRAGGCADDDALAGVWDDTARASVAESFARVERPWAATLQRSFERTIDGWTRAWVDARAQACATASAPDEVTRAIGLARLSCYDDRRERLRALVELVAAGDLDALTGALDAAVALPTIEGCERARPGSEPGDDHAEIEAELGEIEILVAVGRNREAAERLGPVVDRTEDASLRARALLLQGRAWLRLAEIDRAEAALFAGFLAAEEQADSGVAARALVDLVLLRGPFGARLDEADRTARHAAVAIERAGLGAEAEADLARALGLLRRSQGRYDEAIAELERARTLVATAFGDEHPRTASFEAALAGVLADAGRHADAREVEEHALEVAIATYGDSHPIVAGHRATLGALATARGDHDAAVEQHRVAIELFEATYGEEFPERLQELNNLGIALFMRGDAEQAERQLDEVLRLKRLRGASPTSIASSASNLGAVRTEAGRAAEALPLFDEAIVLRERTLGPDHVEVGRVRVNRATALLELGRPEQALAEAEQGLVALERVLGPNSVELIEPVRVLGECRAALGRIEGAAAALERAVALAEDASGDPIARGDALFALARALAGRDPDRALALAERARAAYAGDTPRLRSRTAELDAWLRDAGDER